MNGLFRKELRELRPFVMLGAILLLLDILEWMTQQIDMSPMAVNFGESNEALAVLLFLIAFAAGTGLVVREMEDHTLAFLDGLPVTRLQVFGIKFAVAMLVLLLYPAGHLLMMAAAHVVSRQSLDYAMHAALLWQAAALICVLTAVSLALGLLLGYLRVLCWLTLGLLALTLGMITHFFPEMSVLNPIKLLDLRLVGVQWRVPTASLVTQLVLLLSALALSAMIFVSANGVRGRRLQTSLSRPLISATVTLATIGIAIGAIALIGSTADTKKPPTTDVPPDVEFATSPAVSARTERYSFNYRSEQAERAQALLGEADRIHAEVAVILGAQDGSRIDVDLSGSMRNTEGTAFYDRIRMYLGTRAREVLAHETSHVLARRLAGGERERELTKMNTLNEGLASWVQNRLTGGNGTTELGRFQAAIVSRRHLITAAQLTDIDTLSRQADINLRYPLGAALVDSLVNRYGREAIGKLLRTIGDPDFPRGLAGMELWYAAFQAAGFDLSLVFDDYSRRLQAWEIEFADRIAAVPRPRGSLVYRKGQTGLQLHWDGEMPAGWTGAVRFRPRKDSPVDQYMTVRMTGQFSIWLPAAIVVDGQVCFQPGVATQEATIYEEWVCLPVEPPGD